MIERLTLTVVGTRAVVVNVATVTGAVIGCGCGKVGGATVDPYEPP